MWIISIPNDGVSQNGEKIFYCIKSTKKIDTHDGELCDQYDHEICVTRQYKDFQWLYHHLSTGNDIGGIIIPPIPDKLGSRALEARKIMAGLHRRTSVGEVEATAIDCKKLEIFLNKIVCHPYLAQDNHVDCFLTEQETPERFSFKKRFFDNIIKSIVDHRHQKYKDREPVFQQHRYVINNACTYWKNINQSFSQLNQSQRKVAVALIILASNMVHTGAEIAGNMHAERKLIQSFGECLNFCREAIDAACDGNEIDLGVILDYYADYYEEAKEMLYRRTIRMIDYDSALRIYEKAKPRYHESVSREFYVAYWKADVQLKGTKNAYEQTTETAKNELKRFNFARVRDLRDALLKFGEFQLAAARKCCTVMSDVLVSLKNYR